MAHGLKTTAVGRERPVKVSRRVTGREAEVSAGLAMPWGIRGGQATREGSGKSGGPC